MKKTQLKMYGFTTEEILKSLGDSNTLMIPSSVIVLNHNSGEVETRDNKKQPWANLIVADSSEYEALKGIGMEERAGHIKVSLKGYNGEDLNSLIEKVIPTSSFGLDFETSGKFKQIVGAKFIAHLEDIELV
ncbi:hypothetical protein HRE62_08115 [Enterococcus faecalis]|uniref:hypothetical protein n=1 Tax=Enterococcus sp. AZ136 TaxID=2774788 RepID=UPI0015747E20|nr:hypothetical protein [Enterococcus faecalis]